MSGKPLRPAPPPPVPRHNVKAFAAGISQRDTNNNKENAAKKQLTAPSRPTVIRPKMVKTPKKKPPPRPPPPKSGRTTTQTETNHSTKDSIWTDLDAVFGPSKSQQASFPSVQPRQRPTSFASISKTDKKRPQKPPAPKPASQKKQAAPPPPVPPHKKNNFLISFDSPPSSPSSSAASWSSGFGSQSSQASTAGSSGVSLLDLDVPPLQGPNLPWGGPDLLTSQSDTSDWGASPMTGCGDQADNDPWKIPRNNSFPSFPDASQTNGDPWGKLEGSQMKNSESSPWCSQEPRSPPPPLHPPPEPPPSEDIDNVEICPLAVAVSDYHSSIPSELSFRTYDLIVLLSDEGQKYYRGRCGDEEGLVPKSFLDVINPLPEKSASTQSQPAISVNGGKQKHCKALYDFTGETPDELSLIQGDVIEICGNLDNNWMSGILHGKKGIFPANFVQVIEEETESSNNNQKGCPVIALYTFEADKEGDLGFKEGDTVVVLSRINKDWLYGEHKGQRGQFPASFVQPIGRNRSQSNTEGSIYRALFPFETQHHDELTLRAGDKIEVTNKINADWWQGRLLGDPSCHEGIFPATFVEKFS